MIPHLRQTVDYLQIRVKDNLKRIRTNQDKINNILKEPNSLERNERIQDIKSKNRQLRLENFEGIKIQLQIIKYLNNYRGDLNNFSLEEAENDQLKMFANDQANSGKNEQVMNEFPGATHQNKHNTNSREHVNNELSADDYFNLTVNGEVAFNYDHPFYEDIDFINRLLEHHINTEDYELCQELVTLRDSKI
jgi:hypothetical protein